MAVQDKGLTPMMKQFFSMKAKHPEALMLFRCGDFYETYGEDAVIAAGILGITLTKRNNSAENSVEMAVVLNHFASTQFENCLYGISHILKIAHYIASLTGNNHNLFSLTLNACNIT